MYQYKGIDTATNKNGLLTPATTWCLENTMTGEKARHKRPRTTGPLDETCRTGQSPGTKSRLEEGDGGSAYGDGNSFRAGKCSGIR